MDDDELCLVGLCATDGIGPASVARLREAARNRGVPLHTLMDLPGAELGAEVGLPRAAVRAVAAIGGARSHGRSVLRRLGRAGVRVLIEGQQGYPRRLRESLGNQAPPVLFVAGDVAALHEPCVAVVGSRRPSRLARDAAHKLAGEQAAGGTTVVSGGARGIDTTAHAAAASAGRTVVVPAMGVERFRWRSLSASELSDGGWCVLGQFPPQTGWRAAHALMRNRTIVALSGAVVAFEPRDTGGTWHSCVGALHMRKPLYVATASRAGARGRGLRRLVRLGAVALDPTRMPDCAEFSRLVAEYRAPLSPDQLRLFDIPEL